jgi:hypothetical protein
MSLTPLELDDIQSGALRPRPTPFAATYIILRIGDRSAGRDLMRRLSEVVASAADPGGPGRDTWVSASVTYRGLQALGVPQDSLDSFPLPFREGMAARAKNLGDVGESHPDRWEAPLGSTDVHVVLTAISPDSPHLESALARARKAYEKLPGPRSGGRIATFCRTRRSRSASRRVWPSRDRSSGIPHQLSSGR